MDVVIQLGANEPAVLAGDIVRDSILIAAVSNSILNISLRLRGQSERIQSQGRNSQFCRGAALVAGEFNQTISRTGCLIGFIDQGCSLFTLVSSLDSVVFRVRMLIVHKEVDRLIARRRVLHDIFCRRGGPLRGVVCCRVAGQHDAIIGTNRAQIILSVEHPILDADDILAAFYRGAIGVRAKPPLPISPVCFQPSISVGDQGIIVQLRNLHFRIRTTGAARIGNQPRGVLCRLRNLRVGDLRV